MNGIRTSITVDGIRHDYVLNGSQIISEIWKSGNTEQLLYYVYDENGLPIGLKYRTSAYEAGVFDCFLFEKNLQGDIVAIYNSAGKRIGTYNYDAWGEFNYTRADGNTGLENQIVRSLNPFRYRGYYYDIETGLYYLQSRYYNPEWGRFLNADSVIDQSSVIGANLFVYCLNNPVNMTDETGHLPFFAITAAVGAVVGAVVGGVVAAKNGGNVWIGIGIGAVAGALIGTGAGMVTGAALAGSITATTIQVAFGASTLATMVATGGIGAGVTYVANNLQRAGNEISNAIATTTQKIVSNTPANPGKPFEAGKTGIQHGVNPNTLIPQKDLSTLNPQRMANAVKFGGDQAVRVGRTGIIQDGHHRVADAIMNGRAIDIFVEPYK